MSRKFTTLLMAVGFAFALASNASAISLGTGLGAVKRQAPSKYLVARANTLAPMGHVMFCAKHPAQCRASGAATVRLDAKRMRELRSVNRHVNRRIRAVNDSRLGGFGDKWSLAPRAGDCEDFAITKRAELIRRGWPSRALRLAVARTPSGEGHAVLVVRTTGGDLVLDNRRSSVLPWNRAGLTWLKIQSQSNARRWQAI